MATRRPLGRGLSALIPPPREESKVGRAPETSPEDGPLYIDVGRITPNSAQPRKRFRAEELASLASSIREQGVLQPLVVRRRGNGYELIIGERRWRAAQLAGLERVPAVVLDASDRAVVEMALVENVQREDLNPMELAEAFRVLVENEGMTQEDVGRRVGLDRSTVSNHLRLLELSPTFQQDLIEQRFTMGHAKAILQAAPEKREAIRLAVVQRGLSVRATEEMSRRSASTRASSAAKARGPSRDVHVVALEDRLRDRLQTRVRIVGRRDKGRLELHYFGEAELERLTSRILGETE